MSEKPTPKHSPDAATLAAARAAQAAQITDFRIMRQTEIAPGWWGQAREVGDTPSATVADSFCREQNAVTMNLNRTKRIEYYAEPIFAVAPIPPAVTAALTQYEAATLRYDELAGQDPATRTAADLTAFLDAQQEIFEAVVILADHRRLDLTAPAEAASRYRQAAAHLRDLATHGDYEGCEYVRDEMTMCYCQLAAAGRLDLIGAQS